MSNKSLLLILIIISVLGFFYKSWFSSLVPQPIVFDQTEYLAISKNIRENFGSVSASRTYGYPFFISTVHFLTGNFKNESIFYVQAAIDVLTGIVLFIISLILFKSKMVALLAFIIQIINPYTTAYVRVVLTEIVASCLISFSFLFFILLIKKRSILWAIPLGLTLGYLTQVRPAFLYWNLIPIALVFFYLKNKILPFALIIIGFFIASIYQIQGNIRQYQEYAITTVDRYLGRELYDGALVKNVPILSGTSNPYPQEMQLMFNEYSTLPKNSSERKDMSDKYLKKGIEIIKNDPKDYVLVRIHKMLTMWLKYNLFFYNEPQYERNVPFTFGINLLVVLSSFAGLLLCLKSKVSLIKKASVYCLLLFFYMTISLSLTHAEYRLTIPFYPIMFLFCAVFIFNISRVFRSK